MGSELRRQFEEASMILFPIKPSTSSEPRKQSEDQSRSDMAEKRNEELNEVSTLKSPIKSNLNKENSGMKVFNRVILIFHFVNTKLYLIFYIFNFCTHFNL